MAGKSVPDSCRILRAIQGDGDVQKTEDFVVPAAFLKFSEALEPMSEKDDFLVSEDNVIPMQDSIASVADLVGWLTRDPQFEITATNMKELARLADKYIIPALQNDIRNHLCKYILQKGKPTLELWEFAAQYSFTELEEYCRTDHLVYAQIMKIIRDRERGVKFLHRRQVPVEVLSDIVCDLLSNTVPEVLYHKTFSCDQCMKKPIIGLRFRCLGCPNFDLCEDCYPSRSQFHSRFHAFQQIPKD